jgi:integrase
MASNLYKRGRVYYYNFTFEGVRYNASTGCRYYSQAILVLKKKMAAVVDGKIRPNKSRQLRFDELSTRFLKWSKDHRQGTFRRDVLSVKHLNLFFGRCWIEEINPADVETYMSERKVLVKGSTVNREVQLLRRIYNLAIIWKLVDSNPAQSPFVKYFPEPPKTHRWVRPDEVNALLKVCIGKLKHLYAIILFAVHTGMRKSELFNLKWQYVDMVNRRITIKHAKHFQNRYIPMNDDVLDLLLHDVSKRSEYVFTHLDGRPFTRADKSLATAVKKSGIQKCTLHDFRATWATELLSDGEDIETVRQVRWLERLYDCTALFECHTGTEEKSM